MSPSMHERSPYSWVRRFIEDMRTGIAGTRERRVNVRHTHLDDVGDDACAWCNLIATHVRDDDCTVPSDPELSAVRVADADPFLEAEGGFKPRHRRTHIGINEHRGHGDGRHRAIRQHDWRVDADDLIAEALGTYWTWLEPTRVGKRSGGLAYAQGTCPRIQTVAAASRGSLPPSSVAVGFSS